MSRVRQIIKYTAVVLVLWIGAQTFSWLHFITPLSRYRVPEQASYPQPRSSVQRILIFAPHEDDETLATGGTIYTELQKGNQVFVVFITNGDGFWGDEFLVQADPFHSVHGFLNLAHTRQREALKAVTTLGLPERDVLFLGYPDHGLKYLLTTHWSYHSELYRSPYTHKEHSPYNNSFTPHAPFCGAAVLNDIETIIYDYRPTIIYLPDIKDDNSDHRATGDFVVRALHALEGRGMELVTSIELRAYIVHLYHTAWPTPDGLHPKLTLTPPPQLTQGYTWISYPLSQAATQKKWEALRAYRTQLFVMEGFLDSFVRTNELYRRITLTRDFSSSTGG